MLALVVWNCIHKRLFLLHKLEELSTLPKMYQISSPTRYGYTTQEISPAAEEIVSWISDWRVADYYTASDHLAILYTRLNPFAINRTKAHHPSSVQGWKFNQLSHILWLVLDNASVAEGTSLGDTMELVTAACVAATPMGSLRPRKTPT